MEKKKMLVNIMISLPDITLPKESPFRIKKWYSINNKSSINFNELFKFYKKIVIVIVKINEAIEPIIYYSANDSDSNK